jgi:hypothetical protein
MLHRGTTPSSMARLSHTTIARLAVSARVFGEAADASDGRFADDQILATTRRCGA